MQIICRSCGNQEKFIIPLWVRATFKIEDNGTVSILHVRQLESLEEKLTEQGKSSSAITCSVCDGPAEVVFDEYTNLDQQRSEQAALEGL